MCIRDRSNLPQAEETDHSVKVTFTYLMPTTPASECQLTYEVFGDGKVKTTLTSDPVQELGDMQEYGVIFKFNADYDNVQWYGPVSYTHLDVYKRQAEYCTGSNR